MTKEEAGGASEKLLKSFAYDGKCYFTV